MGRVCVVGAGSSGIASCQVLHARGIPPSRGAGDPGGLPGLRPGDPPGTAGRRAAQPNPARHHAKPVGAAGPPARGAGKRAL